MSFGKRSAVTTSARTGVGNVPAAPGWWRAYGLSLLAAMLGNMLMALGVGVFAEGAGRALAAETDLSFTHFFPRAALAGVSLMLMLAPIFALVGGLMHRFRVVSVLAYVLAITAAWLVISFLLTGGARDRFELGAIALTMPGVLLGSLALGWRLRPKP